MSVIAAFDHTKNPPPCTHAVAIPKVLWRDWIQGSQEMQHAFEQWRHRQEALISHLVETHNASASLHIKQGDMLKDKAMQPIPRAPHAGARLAPMAEPPNVPLAGLDLVDSDEDVSAMEPQSTESIKKKWCWDDSDTVPNPKANSLRSNGAAVDKPQQEFLRDVSDEHEDAQNNLPMIGDDSTRNTEKTDATKLTVKLEPHDGRPEGNADSRGEAVALRMEKFMEWWSTVEEPPHTGCLAKIVLSGKFATLCPIVILMDTVLTAYNANYQAADLYAPRPVAVQIIELCFLVFYVFELCMKMIVHKWFFFINADMKWNIFDTILVLQGVLDNFLALIVDTEGADMTFARLLRLMKLGKIFRLFRAVRFLRDLRVMLFSIMSSFPALFWAAITLGLILYIFALMFVQAMTSYQLESDQLGIVIEEKMMSDIYLYYGSVEKACLTLYKVSSGGKDWEIPYNIVVEAGLMYNLAYIFFIMFFNFAVLNILTGIFMEKALHNTRPDRDSQALEQRRADEKEQAELTKLFYELSGEDGVMTREEFYDSMHDLDVRSTLINLGLEVKDAVMFFDILCSSTGKNACEIDDFVYYCSRMKGPATSIDLQSLAFELKTVHRHVRRLAEFAAGQGASSPEAAKLIEDIEKNRRSKRVSRDSKKKETIF